MAVLATVVWRLGTGPFRDGLSAVDGRALAAAAGIGVVTTVCCAWRWTVVARGLGVPLSLRDAVAAYYRSLFLNLTLPGGVVGDVHRGVSHGRDAHDVSRGLRAVGWERASGQVVQAVITVAVLLALPSLVRSFVPLAALALAAAMIGVVLVGRLRSRGGRSRWARFRNALAGDLRDAVLHPGALPVVVLASAVVVVGHAATFLIAARTAGATAPLSRLLPLALLAMLAIVLPSVAGWGPREGATAWAFGAAGLGADLGVATAVVYGVMSLVASAAGGARPCARCAPTCRSRSRSGGKESGMAERPYTLLSCSVSIDGYIGNAASRLLLSNDDDFDRVDAVRASCDAILVGAATVRIDNPRLLVRSQNRRAERTARGLAPSPMKVTVTRRAELDARADFFTAGEAEKLVYCASPRCPTPARGSGRSRPSSTAATPSRCATSATDLAKRGVERLMVEGGGKVHTQFLTDDLADELQLVVAPFFVGDSRGAEVRARRPFPWNPGRRATLADVRRIGDVVLLRYALSPRFRTD